jgi:hypothetical protein
MERTGEKVCLFLFGSDFGLEGVPLLFIESQCFFEQGEIGIAETFSCLAAMLADFLFLHGAPDPGVRIPSFELFQLKQGFPQHGFPLLKRIHIIFLLMNSEMGPSFWTHTLHSIGRYKAPERRVNTRKKADEAKRSAPTRRMTGGVNAGKKGPKGSSFPAQGSKEVPTSSSV